MFKNLLIITFIILLSLAHRSFAISNAEYELQLKYFTNHSFTQSDELQNEKDYYDQFIKASIQSSIATVGVSPYEFSIENGRRIVKSNKEFELNFLLSPVPKNPTNKEFYNCYKNYEPQIIDERFYSIPLLSNDPFNSAIAPNTNPKIIPNQYRVIPTYSILLNYNIVQPESNYNFFKVVNGEVITITDQSEIIENKFNVCLETISGKYTNSNKEGVDFVFKIVNPEDRNTVHNVIKRSILGSLDKPTIDIEIENNRSNNLKNPIKTKDPDFTNNVFLFIFYGIPFLSVIWLIFIIFKKVRDR
jgi:hypothetical protein